MSNWIKLGQRFHNKDKSAEYILCAGGVVGGDVRFNLINLSNGKLLGSIASNVSYALKPENATVKEKYFTDHFRSWLPLFYIENSQEVGNVKLTFDSKLRSDGVDYIFVLDCLKYRLMEEKSRSMLLYAGWNELPSFLEVKEQYSSMELIK